MMNEVAPKATLQIQPERGLGWIALGSSLHSIVTRLKASPRHYPHLELSYSAAAPIRRPIVVVLPSNGLRLRFDGPDQRLRLIEVLDFSLTALVYKNTDLVRRPKSSEDGGSAPAPDDPASSGAGPAFRHVYSRLFGPTYAGEYLPPPPGHTHGTYVLSYPGLAFTFPVKHASWSDRVDFVSLLSSTATGAATSMALFPGSSWTDVRSTLFTRSPHYPRLPTLVGKAADTMADEIEEVRVHGAGRLELVRRTSPPCTITLGETTPQDLVAELGPPDAIYRKHDRRISIHAAGHPSARPDLGVSPALMPTPTAQAAADLDESSLHSYTEDSDADPEGDRDGDCSGGNGGGDECFYNYFHHGFDVLVSAPTTRSAPFPAAPPHEAAATSTAPLVATKLFLHGNVPGSFAFNRHRRCRWTVQTGAEDAGGPLTSEMPFAEISSALRRVWHDTYKDEDEEKQMQRGMVLNRGWDDSPESSIELLGDLEDSATDVAGLSAAVAAMSNTELFGFPGLLFEVLKNDAVSCLTVF